MITDLQKASMLKRVSAFILDAILLSVMAVMFAWGLSAALRYDDHKAVYDQIFERYAKDFELTDSILQADPDLLTPEEFARRDAADKAIMNDPKAQNAWNMVIHLQLIMITFGFLGGFLLLEFFIPLFLKNGQTIGKKVFGIGIMHTEGIRLRNVALFVRTILGKYAVETMIIALCVFTIYYGMANPLFLIISAALLVIQVILLIVSNENALIHDKMAMTVTVDLASQMIFETREELLEYKKKQHAVKAAAAEY